MTTYRTDLSTGVKAGKLDTTKLAADGAAVEKDAQAQRDRDASALDGLHGVLDGGQRTALVASIRAKQAAREARAKAHQPDGGADDWAKRRLDRMTNELDLDPTQQKSVAALITKVDGSQTPAAMQAKKEEGKKRMDALLTSFVTDAFDAKKLDTDAKRARDAIDKHIQFVSGLLPILKPEQRLKLAAHMDQPMAARPRGGPGSPAGEGHGMGADHQVMFPFAEVHEEED
jgi:hypothetical protein